MARTNEHKDGSYHGIDGGMTWYCTSCEEPVSADLTPYAWDSPTPPVARCGRTDPHGMHIFYSRGATRRVCVGNLHIVRGITADDAAAE